MKKNAGEDFRSARTRSSELSPEGVTELTVDFRWKTVFSDNTFAFRGPFIFSRAGLVRKTFSDQDDMRAGIRQATLCPNNNEIDLPDK